MRMLLKCKVPAIEGNIGIMNGTFQKLVAYFETEFKPEAIYFIAEDGFRTTMMIVDMKDPSYMPAMAEPWFLAMNVKLEFTPVMIPADLEKAKSSIDKAINQFGQ